MGLYGVILLITGFFTSDSQLDRADGFNVNIVGGIGMIVDGRAVRALGAAAADRRARARREHDDPTDRRRPAGH